MKRKRRDNDHLPFRVLLFDPKYQRDFSPAKVRALIANWAEEAIGVIHVSVRADGKAYVVDGQHRVRAAMELGLGEMKVPCRVYRGLSVKEESQLFLYLNDSKNVAVLDRYRAGLIAGDPVWVGIRDTLAHYGLKAGNGAGQVRCLGKLKTLWQRDQEAVDAVCLILTQTWGTRTEAFEASIVDGVGRLVRRYNGELDEGVLIGKLSKYPGGPTALLGDARGLAGIRHSQVGVAVAEVIVDTYNRGRRSGQLSPL